MNKTGIYSVYESNLGLVITEDKGKFGNWAYDTLAKNVTNMKGLVILSEEEYFNRGLLPIIGTDMTYKLSGLNQFRINQNKEEDLNTLSTNALIENDIINERMKGLNGPLKERIVADIWKEGYKANKAKTFTEDEVRDAIREARFLKDWWNLEFEHSDDYIIDKLRGPRKLVGVEVELESMDVDETYEKYKYDTTRMFHFHHYDSGYKTIKKEFQHLYMHPKETNGIVEVKRHIYE